MNNQQSITTRSQSLDALRGISILLMVLSGSIAFGGVLPGWMYHAQEPPPQHIFRPELPGITWVDLVFPFFLFSMGAAIPLAYRKRMQKGEPKWSMVVHSCGRFLLLAFFGLFLPHANPRLLSEGTETTVYGCLLSLCAYAFLFLVYCRWGGKWQLVIKAVLISSGLIFFWLYPFSGGGFNTSNSNIIIILLADMALFGGILWVFTSANPLIRIGVLPFIMAVLLAGNTSGTINSYIFNFTPAPWLYQFFYLKYLFIIIPGTIAGDWMLKHITEGKTSSGGHSAYPAAFLLAGIIISNIAFLYLRWLFLNLSITLLLGGMLVFLFREAGYFNRTSLIFGNFLKAGLYLLLLGLFFEAYENGIKKDHSTYSYYFVCSGLAFLALLLFNMLEMKKAFPGVFKWLSDTGKNPMIAYSTGSLFLIPLLKLTRLDVFIDQLNSNAAEGLFRGIIFTSVVSAVTVFFTRKKLFWRT